MIETFGISHGGRSAEELFIQLTGATLAPTTSIGDALVEGFPIEVKRASSNTLNQVRAVKYIPLVALDSRTGSWYVIPPHIVVAEVSRRRRGQHTENPFESATLSLSRLRSYLAEPGELAIRTLSAVEEGANFPEVRDAMKDTLRQSRALAESSLAVVRPLVEAMGFARR